MPYYNRYSRYGYSYPNYAYYNKSNYKNDQVSSNAEKNKNRQVKNDTTENKKTEESRNISNDSPVFQFFGINLYFDDILLICLILFLYLEDVKDESLFIVLILLLLS